MRHSRVMHRMLIDNLDQFARSLLSTHTTRHNHRVKRAKIKSQAKPLTSENNSAETLDDIEGAEEDGEQITEGGMGKPVRKPTTKYAVFWRHRDDINWESDEEFT
ncbi:hypothetical protein C8J57DRAFT_1243581 [Mycena rebaudengoi]|nr:hypothetical protein C8J57DRAFT_1243581 [Mycena rebaudengoi]